MFVLLLGALLLLTACTSPPLQAERAVEQGNEALLEGDLVSAERHYREALTFEPLPPTAVNARNSVVYNNLGNAFYRQALWQDAQNAFEQALTTADSPQQAVHHYNLGNVFMQRVRMGAQSVQQLNQPQTAPQQAAPQDDVSPDDLSPEQLTQAAIAHYQDALRRNPDDEDAKYNLELALQQNAQQNQQQNQQQEDQQEQQEQQDDNEGDNESDNEGDNEEEQEEQEQQEQQDEQGEQDEGQPEPPEPGDDEEQPATPPPLTQAQALQLLEAAAEQSDTLPEYLQRMMAPLPPPEQDW